MFRSNPNEVRTVFGAEMEVVFARPRTDDEEWALQRNLRPINSDIPPYLAPSVTSEQVTSMQDYYASLKPASDEERAVQQGWLATLRDGVTHEDVVNFEVYRRLARPTLESSVYPVGTSYKKVIKNARELEFRGPGDDRHGWYDAPGVSEFRMHPTPHRKFRAAKAELMHGIGAVAAQMGHRTFLASQHVNGSSYRGEVPILGEIANLEPYKAAVVGLSRVFREGGALAADNPDAYYYNHLTFGHSRTNTVRIIPGRLEWRGSLQVDGAEAGNGLRMLDAGMRYGALHATDVERDAVQDLTMLAIEYPSDYDVVRDYSLQLAIEACAIKPKLDGNGYDITPILGNPRPAETMRVLTGRPAFIDTGSFARELEGFFSHGVEMTPDGVLQTNEALLARARLPDLELSYIRLEDMEYINETLRRFKVRPIATLQHATPTFDRNKASDFLKSATVLPQFAPEDHRALVAAYS